MNRKINYSIMARHIIDGKVVWKKETKYQTTLVDNGEDYLCDLINGEGKAIKVKKGFKCFGR